MECSPVINFGSEVFGTEQGAFSGNLYAEAQQNNIVGTRIYQYCGDFGGLTTQNSVFWYDIQTKETGSISIASKTARSQNATVSVGSKIYSFGGKTSTSRYNYLDIFDVVTSSVTSVSLKYAKAAGPFCAHKDGKIYFGGGNEGSSTSNTALAVYDIETGAFKSITSNFNIYAAHSSAIFVGDYLYLIGCGSSSSAQNKRVIKVDVETGAKAEVLELPANYYSPVVACFDNRYIYVLGGTPTTSVTAPSLKIDTVTKTYEQLSDNFSTYSFGTAYGIVGNKVYVLGGGPSYAISPTTNTVRSFTAQSDLQSNHLFLQQDFGTDGLWTALKSKDTDFKVKVINAYLGDSNNIAQLTNAYLYDSKDLKWKSLSGESYVADMQNALNILGVN